jgi:precorrin-2/cobalt-factor-2 C20-methyltransferase
MARIYAVGVGPGDPELITRKAERILRQVPVICAPVGTADAASYALSIVEPIIGEGHREIIPLVFPMSNDPAVLATAWDDAVTILVGKVASGQDVAFITIGDPLLYSTFLHLYRIIRQRHPDIAVELIPGISSINAAAAVAALPLGIGGERIAILPAPGDEAQLRRTIEEFDTIVIMKVHRVFDRVHALLQELGLDRQAVFVRRAGSPQEELVTNLASLVGTQLDYLSLLIVRKNPFATLSGGAS